MPCLCGCIDFVTKTYWLRVRMDKRLQQLEPQQGEIHWIEEMIVRFWGVHWIEQEGKGEICCSSIYDVAWKARHFFRDMRKLWRQYCSLQKRLHDAAAALHQLFSSGREGHEITWWWRKRWWSIVLLLRPLVFFMYTSWWESQVCGQTWSSCLFRHIKVA